MAAFPSCFKMEMIMENRMKTDQGVKITLGFINRRFVDATVAFSCNAKHKSMKQNVKISSHDESKNFIVFIKVCFLILSS